MSLDIDAAIREVMKDMGPPEHRAAYGKHVPLAWIVRGLAEQGYGVSESVRKVVEKAGMDQDEKAAGSIRAAYYRIARREWPVGMARAAAAGGMQVTGAEEEHDEYEV